MTVLVTGGAGFIGSHLCEALLNQGKEVVCLDNFLTGSKDNIAGLLNHPKFTLIEHDITSPITHHPSPITHHFRQSSQPRGL